MSVTATVATGIAVGAVCNACSPGANTAHDELDPVTLTVTHTQTTAKATDPPETQAAPVASPPYPQEQVSAAVAAGLAVGGGSASVAVARNGSTVSAGFTAPAPAWSTSKVPLAVAALRANPGLADTAAAAITVSDNDAAQALWDSLGGGEAAAGAVQQIIAEAGEAIAVPAQVTRPGFTVFGQTQWSVDSQARFAAALPSLAGAAPVLELMGEVSPEQSYGLGTLPGCAFKGGWGPDESGMYLARQMGVLADGSGVALIAIPADGSYTTAQQMLTAMATELAGAGS